MSPAGTCELSLPARTSLCMASRTIIGCDCTWHLQTLVCLPPHASQAAEVDPSPFNTSDSHAGRALLTNSPLPYGSCVADRYNNMRKQKQDIKPKSACPCASDNSYCIGGCVLQCMMRSVTVRHRTPVLTEYSPLLLWMFCMALARSAASVTGGLTCCSHWLHIPHFIKHNYGGTYMEPQATSPLLRLSMH